MTQKAIKDIEKGVITNAVEFLNFLEQLENINAAADFFAHIRVLHSMVRSTKDIFDVTLEAMDDVQKLLGFDHLPGVQLLIFK